MHDNNVPTNPKTDALKSKEKGYPSAVLRNTPATEKLNGPKNAVGLPLSRNHRRRFRNGVARKTYSAQKSSLLQQYVRRWRCSYSAVCCRANVAQQATSTRKVMPVSVPLLI